MVRCKVRPSLFLSSKQPPELPSRLSIIIIISHPTDNHHHRQIPTRRLSRSRPLRARRPARKDGPGCRRLLPAERPQRTRPAAQGGRHAQGQNGTEWKGCPEINREYIYGLLLFMCHFLLHIYVFGPNHLFLVLEIPVRCCGIRCYYVPASKKGFVLSGTECCVTLYLVLLALGDRFMLQNTLRTRTENIVPRKVLCLPHDYSTPHTLKHLWYCDTF